MTDTRRVFITGRGVLSPLGTGWDSFAAALRHDVMAPAAPFPGALLDDPVLCHPISDPAVLESSGPGGDVEPLSALATVAVREALFDAGISSAAQPLDDVGLVMNTVFGPSLAVETYLERLREGGPKAARPALFVDTLLSMPASRVGIALGLRGSTAVMAGSSPFELALDWVRAGRETTVVAGGGEYLSPKTLRHHRARVVRSGNDRALLSQGAAFVVMEEADHTRERGAEPFAEVLATGASSEPQDVGFPWSMDPQGNALACAMRAALKEGSMAPTSVSSVVFASADDSFEQIEIAALRAVFEERASALRILRPKRQLGEALGASAGLGLLAALAEAEVADEQTLALVNAFEMGGNATTIAVQVNPA